MPKWDFLKTDHWKNVSYLISSLISNFFILNREILTKMIQDFSIQDFSIPENFFRCRDLRSCLFQSHPCLLQPRFHWRCFKVKMPATVTTILLALVILEGADTDRITSIGKRLSRVAVIFAYKLRQCSRAFSLNIFSSR